MLRNPPMNAWTASTDRLRQIAAIALLATLAGVAQGEQGERPAGATGSPEQQLLADAADGTLDSFSLLDAALIAGTGDEAGGDDDEGERQALRTRFDELRGRLAASPPTDSPYLQAGQILRFLHREILTGEFRVEATHVGHTLAHGDYNCVTATILFHSLARDFGLPTRTVATKSHVFCRFQAGERFDVEATCAEWFDLPPDSPVYASHPAQQAVGMRELTDVELLGKVYYNRAGDRATAGDYEVALELLEIALQLDPDDRAAHDNLLATLNNWALALAAAGNFDGAAALLGRGFELAPDYEPFLANDLHIHQQWALALCRQGDFAEALARLEACYQRRPEVELFDRGRLAVYRLWIDRLIETDDRSLAASVLDNACLRFPGDRASLLEEFAGKGNAKPVAAAAVLP